MQAHLSHQLMGGPLCLHQCSSLSQSVSLNNIKILAILILTVIAAHADDIYQHSAFGSNPLQSPPTVPIRIEGDYQPVR
jgi:hypothetical protein